MARQKESRIDRAYRKLKIGERCVVYDTMGVRYDCEVAGRTDDSLILKNGKYRKGFTEWQPFQREEIPRNQIKSISRHSLIDEIGDQIS